MAVTGFQVGSWYRCGDEIFKCTRVGNHGHPWSNDTCVHNAFAHPEDWDDVTHLFEPLPTNNPKVSLTTVEDVLTWAVGSHYFTGSGAGVSGTNILLVAHMTLPPT